jgi:hypothetical protein
MGCGLTRLGDGFGGHRHGFDEICMITGSSTVIQHAGTDTHAVHGSVYLFRAGETHSFKNSSSQAPRLWVLHYWPDPQLTRECPALGNSPPASRIWQLDHEQIEEYRQLFMRVLGEEDAERTHASAAAAAWLRLLLLTLSRWRSRNRVPGLPAIPTTDPELTHLWQIIQDHVGSPESLSGGLRKQVPNYDSLRHRFTRIFKASPRQVLMSMRISLAKSLLLESSLPIAAVAERLGYARQHEFARAFQREVGCTATAWRKHAGSITPIDMRGPHPL